MIGGEKADVDTDGFRDAGIKPVFVHSVFAAREADIGNLLETDGLAGFGFKPLIERDGIFVNLADRVAHVEEWQQAGCMPGRARCQFLAFEQDDIRPTLLGQMIEGRDADNAASNDHDTRMFFHGNPLFAGLLGARIAALPA